MPFEITWRPIALQDLNELHRYIANDDPAAANRVRTAIAAAVARLANYPNLGRPGRVAETRELVISRTPYIVAYTVLGDQVMILSILHGSRQWPEHF
jgi:toxin ParE1/3/4